MFDFLRRRFGKNRPSIDPALWDRAEAGLPFLAYLEPSVRTRLRELARAFLADKQFYGAHGLPLTDEMLLAIALQACLPILNIGLDAYRGWVGIVVYAGDFVIPRHQTSEDGVVHEFEDEVLGEAWEDGPVLLSWHEHVGDADGANVVIHEFAHKLDMANGDADGFPPLLPGMSREIWARDFTAAYEELCAAVDADQPTALDPYAAEHPAEFFAVASETFFETPDRLLAAYPAIYAHFRDYYGTDPAHGLAQLRGEA